MTDFLNRSDLMRKLNNKPLQKTHFTIRPFDLIVILLFGVILGLVLSAFTRERKPPAITGSCSGCHAAKKQSSQKHKLIGYFKKAGNKHPEQMANAVMATGKPRLLAAVAVAGEKNTPYTVRKGGYKKRHAGAWQVNSKYWGQVPHDPVGQAIQAERILRDLAETKNIRTALSIYGGDSSSNYASRVLKEMKEVPL